MSHSHVAFEHLMKQVELYEKRQARKDNRPDWLCQLIENVADLFNPESEFARVGYDCFWDGEQWKLAMFLGAVEVVGGSDDGAQEYVSFEFDLPRLLDEMDDVERVWTSNSSNSIEPHSADNVYSVEGQSHGERITITILSKPPTECDTAMKRYEDGRLEAV